MSKRWIIVPAAGVGARMRSTDPKQYLPLLDCTVIEHTLHVLAKLDAERIIIVLNPADQHFSTLSFNSQLRASMVCVNGGQERSDSVYQALLWLESRAAEDDWVIVHDAARPCLQLADVRALMLALEQQPHFNAGLLGAPVRDTLKRVEPTQSDQTSVTHTVSRAQLWSALTPQVARYGLLRRALEYCHSAGLSVTDEAMAIEEFGAPVLIQAGREDNIKITRPTDLALAAAVLSAQQQL